MVSSLPVRALRTFASSFAATPSPARQTWELPLLGLLVAVALAVRLWGVGSWGLELDEETMAMPVMHIVEHGEPRFPSGMYYGRAIGQLYLMAGSVALFGESEWALRFPSVLCGVLLVVLAYGMGRRFLSPLWNMAFTATAALLPTFIADSQEARMYIFMLASLTGYTWLVFRWEATRNALYWAAAIVVVLIGVHFQSLAVFGALILLFPGLLHGDRKLLTLGLVGLGFILAGFVVIDQWAQSFYPPLAAEQLGTAQSAGMVAPPDASVRSLSLLPWVLVPGALLSVGLAWLVSHPIRSTFAARLCALLIGSGLLLQLFFVYHLGVLLMVAGCLVALRATPTVLPRVLIVLLVSLLGLACAIVAVASTNEEPLRKVLGMIVGFPSIWPYLRFATYSIVACLITGVGLVLALGRWVRREQMADHWLFFTLAVWAPLILIGCVTWDVAPRYVEFALLPLLICTFATLNAVVWSEGFEPALPLGAVGAALLIVNPIAFARTVNAGYSLHPDHKGAAEFIASAALRPEDIVVAEDVLQQTYYLRRVDYWLRSAENASTFVRPANGVLRDIYTNTPLIGTGAELLDLINRPDRGDIYVIGSGEFKTSMQRRLMRGYGIAAVLQSPALELVHMGRDGVTSVWKAPRGARLASIPHENIVLADGER
jgi:4-amino-4-deoxy-L-arabinose transferase-like glycosyltransferase